MVRGDCHRRWMLFLQPFSMAGEQFVENTSSTTIKLITRCFYRFILNPSSPLTNPFWRGYPLQTSDRADPQKPRHRRGKRHHHGGYICCWVLLIVDSTFSISPTTGASVVHYYVISIVILFGWPPSTMDAVLATIFDGGQAIRRKHE